MSQLTTYASSIIWFKAVLCFYYFNVIELFNISKLLILNKFTKGSDAVDGVRHNITIIT